MEATPCTNFKVKYNPPTRCNPAPALSSSHSCRSQGAVKLYTEKSPVQERERGESAIRREPTIPKSRARTAYRDETRPVFYARTNNVGPPRREAGKQSGGGLDRV